MQHDIDDQDYPEITILRQTKARARGVHKCSCCDELIMVGEVYLTVVITEDGEFKAEKVCGRH